MRHWKSSIYYYTVYMYKLRLSDISDWDAESSKYHVNVSSNDVEIN